MQLGLIGAERDCRPLNWLRRRENVDLNQSANEAASPHSRDVLLVVILLEIGAGRAAPHLNGSTPFQLLIYGRSLADDEIRQRRGASRAVLFDLLVIVERLVRTVVRLARCMAGGRAG